MPKKYCPFNLLVLCVKFCFIMDQPLSGKVSTFIGWEKNLSVRKLFCRLNINCDIFNRLLVFREAFGMFSWGIFGIYFWRNHSTVQIFPAFTIFTRFTSLFHNAEKAKRVARENKSQKERKRAKKSEREIGKMIFPGIMQCRKIVAVTLRSVHYIVMGTL